MPMLQIWVKQNLNKRPVWKHLTGFFILSPQAFTTFFYNHFPQETGANYPILKG